MNHTRVQTGVRMEKRLVKVLKALAELRDLSLGDLLEYIVRAGFAGEEPFTSDEVQQITELTRIYGLDLSHWRRERAGREVVPEAQASK
jgi:predicted DNA-binding ribbon-helix-helix protein